ncbi:hypothetical protein [Fibrella arboris]|uniref:hypothetical protein n=1 Tax=Fibrella arboris TaxID=3242486 RepID=UPI003522E1CA
MNRELTYSHRRQLSFGQLGAVLKQQLTRFINDNPTVFEAISRTGAPFGGNSLPTISRVFSADQPSPLMHPELDLLRQQVDALTQQVAQLHQTLHDTEAIIQQRSAQHSRQATTTAGKQIGIDRFWALQGKSQVMA